MVVINSFLLDVFFFSSRHKCLKEITTLDGENRIYICELNIDHLLTHKLVELYNHL